MTVKELKEEAKKLGYVIAKKQEYVKLVPCSNCGSKRVYKWLGPNHTQFYRCRDCLKESQPVRHNYQARKAWNEANS